MQTNKPSLAKLAWATFYIGIAGYGGGPAIIAFLKQYIVDREQWMSEEEFLTGVSLSQMLPGANALSTVVYLGYQLAGAVGALVTPITFIIPSCVLMTGLSALYFAYGQWHLAQALFTGLSAVVVGLLANALLVMGRSAIRDLPAAGIALCIFLAMSLPELWGVDVPILLIIALAAMVGIGIYTWPHSRYALPPQTDAPDVAPPSPWFWGRWLLAIAAVITLLLCGRQFPLDRLMLSFLRVGALTFGGGYSAVPLFQREAVTATQWLTNKQFLDGLALGQITPGPVLITATFIGYRVAGVLGAVLGTIAVFLPGGLAMYFAASQHERVQHLRWLQALVKGIVAGFIGVLLNITIRLAFQSIFDWKTIVLAVASALALTVFRRDPLWVILGGAVLSLLLFR